MNNDDKQGQGWATATTLAEALPFIQTYNRSIVVIKYGGHAIGDEPIAKQFAADCVLLKMLGLHPVIVHGGGPQISATLQKLGIQSTFVDGFRVTDAATMDVVEMVLSGEINKEIANLITLAGQEADVHGVGLSGKDAGLITAEKTGRAGKQSSSSTGSGDIDLGFVGVPKYINPTLIKALIHAKEARYIPVIAPVGVSEGGQTYNVNADLVAGALATALNAKRTLLLTAVPGVLDKGGNLIRQLTVTESRALITDGTATDGMIPKLETAIAAVENGVNAVVIMDGRRSHALLVELFTKHGSGTLIHK